MFSQMQVSVFCFYILDTICSISSTVKQKYSASFVKSKEFSQKCLTNKAKTAILKIFTAMGLLVYHEKGFDGKKRERILHRRESAAGVSRQQGVQDNWSPSRRRNRRALSRISRLCRILSVSRVHIVRCDEWTHTLRQKEWYHGEKWIFVSFVQMKISVWKGLFLLTEQIAADHMTG